ncbi:MAG TPA: hypothetical protein VFJ74_16830, partial [Gemmatimonadaceae bacterium]|nr:hypothetical protein [Gemmatimonadaceae bacterium]
MSMSRPPLPQLELPVAEPKSSPPSGPAAAASTESPRQSGLLIKIETDRRLGHEWDEWDGKPLDNGGDFRGGSTGKFWLFTAIGLACVALVALVAIYLLAPRLATLHPLLPSLLYGADVAFGVLSALWLALVAISYVTHRALLPGKLAEQGLLLKTLRLASRVGELFGVKRDWTDNAAVAVYNRLAWARDWRVRANEL